MIFTQVLSNDDMAAYKVNYTRWLCYCHVPAFCDSLQHYDTSLIFGKTLIKSVFQVQYKEIANAHTDPFTLCNT